MFENCKSNVIEHLESIDAQLLALDAMLELAEMGAKQPCEWRQLRARPELHQA